MEDQEAFQLAAERALPAAITAKSDGSQQYGIGNIVYHSAKPTIISWRKQNVQFARSEGGDGGTLASILTPDSTRRLSQLRPQSTLFANTGKRETTREFTVANYQRTGKVAVVKADFGEIYQTTSNLLGLLGSASGKLRADDSNAVVGKVLENGGYFYVVSTVYEADRVEVSVREEAQGKEVPQWRKVYSRPEKTVLAFLLVKLFIGSDGVITFVRHGGYVPSSLSMEESDDSELQGEEDVDSAYTYAVYQCGQREFQMFQSDTYNGVIHEATEFVKALTQDKELQKVFIAALQKPGNTLEKLSNELHALQERLVSQSGEQRTVTSFPELLDHLSTPSPHTLDQVKALTVATEAFKELSPVTSKRILSLNADERKMLFELFMQLPLGHTAHTFSRPVFPDSDLIYWEILTRIGFGDSRGFLSYEADEFGADLIAVAITAIQATTVVV